jgi:hypothetical protein
VAIIHVVGADHCGDGVCWMAADGGFRPISVYLARLASPQATRDLVGVWPGHGWPDGVARQAGRRLRADWPAPWALPGRRPVPIEGARVRHIPMVAASTSGARVATGPPWRCATAHRDLRASGWVGRQVCPVRSQRRDKSGPGGVCEYFRLPAPQALLTWMPSPCPTSTSCLSLSQAGAATGLAQAAGRRSGQPREK